MLDEGRARDVAVVARGGAVQVLGQFVQGAVAFLFVALVVRLLGTAPYGLFRQVAQILAIAAQVGLAGFNYAAMRHIALARATGDVGAVRGSARVAMGGAAIASTVVFVGLQVGAPALAGRFADGTRQSVEMTSLLRLGAFFVPLFALTQVLRYCTQAYKTMVPSVVVGNIVQPLLRLLCASALIVAGFGVGGAVAGMLFASGVALGTALVLFRRLMSSDERTAPPRAHRWPIARFAFLQGGASILGIQTLGLGVLILGALGTDRDVGLLGIALALQTPGTLFLGGIVNIWAPMVTDLYERGEMDRLRSLYRTVTRWVVTFSLPVFAALIVVPDLFVDVLAGGRGAGAGTVVAVLALGNIFYACTGPTGFLLSMTGHPGINLANSAVAVVLYVTLGVLVVPHLGVIGIAAVDASVTALVNGARLVEAKWLVGVHPFGRSLVKPVVATSIAVVVLRVSTSLLGDGPGRLGALALGGAVYIGALWRMGLDPEERAVWTGIKRRASHVVDGLGWAIAVGSGRRHLRRSRLCDRSSRRRGMQTATIRGAHVPQMAGGVGWAAG